MTATTTTDRSAWAKYLAELGAAGYTHAQIAEMADTHPRTINKWLNRDVDPNPTSVRNLARGLGRNPNELFALVGFLTRAEAGIVLRTARALEPLAAELDALLRGRLLSDVFKDDLRDRVRQAMRSVVNLYRAGNAPADVVDRKRARRAGA